VRLRRVRLGRRPSMCGHLPPAAVVTTRDTITTRPAITAHCGQGVLVCLPSGGRVPFLLRQRGSVLSPRLGFCGGGVRLRRVRLCEWPLLRGHLASHLAACGTQFVAISPCHPLHGQCGQGVLVCLPSGGRVPFLLRQRGSLLPKRLGPCGGGVRLRRVRLGRRPSMCVHPLFAAIATTRATHAAIAARRTSIAALTAATASPPAGSSRELRGRRPVLRTALLRACLLWRLPTARGQLWAGAAPSALPTHREERRFFDRVCDSKNTRRLRPLVQPRPRQGPEPSVRMHGELHV